LLYTYYQEASDQLETGKYIVNTSIIKELRMYLSQITKIATLAASGTALFLLAMHSLEPVPLLPLDTEELIERGRDKTELVLRTPLPTQTAPISTRST
jgi:hypothetical protein